MVLLLFCLSLLWFLLLLSKRTMATKMTDKAGSMSAAASTGGASGAPEALVSVRVLRNGVHAGRLILGKGAVVLLPPAEAQALSSAGSAILLNR